MPTKTVTPEMNQLNELEKILYKGFLNNDHRLKQLERILQQALLEMNVGPKSLKQKLRNN